MQINVLGRKEHSFHASGTVYEKKDTIIELSGVKCMESLFGEKN